MFGEIITSLFGGGITGLLGGVLTRIADYFTIKQKNSHEVEMSKLELEQTKLEADRDIIIAKDRTMSDREIAETEAIIKSHEFDKASYVSSAVLDNVSAKTKAVIAVMMALVDFVRGMTRPGLTLYLCVVTTWLAITAYEILEKADQAALSGAELGGLLKMITHGIVYLTATAVSWWFASRSKMGSEK